jgi:hypothetical protein
MTKKDCERLALALKVTMPPVHGDDRHEYYQALFGQWEIDCWSIANALADENPRFNIDKFLLACGVTKP